jgi:hypothetical protein
LLRRLAEIAAGRHFDAPGAAAEIDRIEIDFEDLVLAERGFDPCRHDHFADLALIAELLAHQEVLGDLLGDGRPALRAPGAGEVADEGAYQAMLVDALVLVEALVLRGQEGIAHLLRDSRKRHPDATLVVLEHFREWRTLAVEHDARTRKLEAFEPAMIRQVGRRLVVEVDDLAEIDGGSRDRLVLAELAVGRLQVGEIDPAQRLAPADRLRIFHGGRDQVVDIDVLELERLDHVGAAGMEELRDLRLIPDAVELRFHGIRRGHHLTERKGGGEYLEEKRFHRTCGTPAKGRTRTQNALNMLLCHDTKLGLKYGGCIWARRKSALTAGNVLLDLT